MTMTMLQTGEMRARVHRFHLLQLQQQRRRRRRRGTGRLCGVAVPGCRRHPNASELRGNGRTRMHQGG